MAYKTQHYSIPPGYPGGGRGKYDQFKGWDTSPRNAQGKLELRSNYCLISRTTEVGYENHYDSQSDWMMPDVRSGYPFSGDGGLNLSREGSGWDGMYNAAYSRFRGKLYKGGASLGVTFAGIRQSRDMIASRMEKLGRFSTDLVGRTRRNPKKFRDMNDVSRARASDILEYEFGWVPLVQDVHAFLTTAIDTPKSPFIRARSGGPVQGHGDWWDGNAHIVDDVEGTAWVTIAAQAVISNPNLWLANRLGLINPATVIWDLVPWSFVVNMFVNINAILNSYTDFLGLELRDLSVTRRSKLTWTRTVSERWNDQYKRQQVVQNQTFRNVGGSLPRPSLQFQLPKGNWELALISGALCVQNFQKVTRLMTLARSLR